MIEFLSQTAPIDTPLAAMWYAIKILFALDCLILPWFLIARMLRRGTSEKV